MQSDPDSRKENTAIDQDDSPKFGRLLLVLVAAVLFVVGLTVFTVAYHS